MERGWDIYHIYCDEDYSGADSLRPDFNRMIQAAQEKKFQILLCKSQSRFTRDMELVEKYIHGLFPIWGIRFIAVADNADTEVKGNKKARQINGLVNEWYLEDLSENIRMVFDMKRRQGQYIGGFPIYGYRKDPDNKGHLLVDPEAAEVVRQIFRWSLEGHGKQSIAHMLNDLGVVNPTRYKAERGWDSNHFCKQDFGLWNKNTVWRILRNEIYTGVMVQGRTKKVSYKSKAIIVMPRDRWFRVEGTHEALVDVETFRKVRMLVNSRKLTRSRTYDFLLKGLIFCHECGYPLAVLNRKNARGEDVLYFVCRTYQRFTKAGACTCHSIKEKTVTDAVIAKVREVCQTYLNPDELLPVAREAVENAGKQSSLGKELQALQSKIDSLTANLDRMYTDRLSGLLPEADFQRIFGRIKLEREQLEAKRQELELRQKSPVRSEDRARELVQRFIETAGESRELLVSLIERVELTEDKEVIIKFRFAQLDEASQNSQGIAPFETA